MENLETKSYKELQEIAKKLDIQFVGITTENLIKSIEEKRASFEKEEGAEDETPVDETPVEETEDETEGEDETPVEETEDETEGEDETPVDETEEEVEVVAENKFNGQTIIDTNIKIVNGKSYKEVKIVSGEVFLLTEEEYQKGLKK